MVNPFPLQPLGAPCFIAPLAVTAAGRGARGDKCHIIDDAHSLEMQCTKAFPCNGDTYSGQLLLSASHTLSASIPGHVSRNRENNKMDIIVRAVYEFVVRQLPNGMSHIKTCRYLDNNFKVVLFQAQLRCF